jgi:hypothetical protein
VVSGRHTAGQRKAGAILRRRHRQSSIQKNIYACAVMVRRAQWLVEVEIYL